jgi:hypothetical protein
LGAARKIWSSQHELIGGKNKVRRWQKSLASTRNETAVKAIKTGPWSPHETRKNEYCSAGKGNDYAVTEQISVRQNRNLGKQKSSAVRCAPAQENRWRLESGRANNAGIGDEQTQACGAKPDLSAKWNQWNKTFSRTWLKNELHSLETREAQTESLTRKSHREQNQTPGGRDPPSTKTKSETLDLQGKLKARKAKNLSGNTNITYEQQKPSFLLKFNKITTDSWRSPPSLPHLIGTKIWVLGSLLLYECEMKLGSGNELHPSRVLYIGPTKMLNNYYAPSPNTLKTVKVR